MTEDFIWTNGIESVLNDIKITSLNKSKSHKDNC